MPKLRRDHNLFLREPYHRQIDVALDFQPCPCRCILQLMLPLLFPNLALSLFLYAPIQANAASIFYAFLVALCVIRSLLVSLEGNNYQHHRTILECITAASSP